MDVVPLERNKTWETSAQGTGKNIFQLVKYLKLPEFVPFHSCNFHKFIEVTEINFIL